MPIYHYHHIIPKHMGGSNDSSNLVKVTIEQHAELHKQLWEDLGHWQDRVAWQMLSGQITMDTAKQEAIRMGQLKSAEKNRNRKWTEEEKQKLRGPRPHVIPKNKGKKTGPRPESVKEKIRETLLGKKHSIDRVEKNRIGQLKRFSDPIERQKNNEVLKKAREIKQKKKENTQC